jgi:hypothetical protein
VRLHSYSPYKYTKADIKGMLGFLVDNIFVVFGDQGPYLLEFEDINVDTNPEVACAYV